MMAKIKLPANAAPRVDGATVAAALGANPVELLPCPFCGYADEVDLVQFTNNRHSMSCARCSVLGPVAGYHKEAIAKWNSRRMEAQ